MDVGLTGWDFVRGLCRDAGRLSYTANLELSFDFVQDCGIRDKGSSPASGQHAQQSEPHGPTRLCPRSKKTSRAEGHNDGSSRS